MAFTARLSPDLEAMAEAFCLETGMPKSVLLRRAVEDYVRRHTPTSAAPSAPPASVAPSSAPVSSLRGPKPKPQRKPPGRSGLAGSSPASRREMGL